MRWFKYLLLLALFLLAVSFPLARDLRHDNGSSLEGFVLDENSVPIAQASIEVRNIFRGESRTAISDSKGFYTIPDLDPGRYSLWAQARGYTSTWIPKILVMEGQATRQDLRLIHEAIPTSTL